MGQANSSPQTGKEETADENSSQTESAPGQTQPEKDKGDSKQAVLVDLSLPGLTDTTNTSKKADSNINHDNRMATEPIQLLSMLRVPVHQLYMHSLETPDQPQHAHSAPIQHSKSPDNTVYDLSQETTTHTNLTKTDSNVNGDVRLKLGKGAQDPEDVRQLQSVKLPSEHGESRREPSQLPEAEYGKKNLALDSLSFGDSSIYKKTKADGNELIHDEPQNSLFEPLSSQNDHTVNNYGLSTSLMSPKRSGSTTTTTTKHVYTETISVPRTAPATPGEIPDRDVTEVFGELQLSSTYNQKQQGE